MPTQPSLKHCVGRQRSSIVWRGLVTTFPVLDDEQTEILRFGLNTALRTERQAMAEIMGERLERAADGEEELAKWKEAQFNSLLFRVFQGDVHPEA